MVAFVNTSTPTTNPTSTSTQTVPGASLFDSIVKAAVGPSVASEVTINSESTAADIKQIHQAAVPEEVKNRLADFMARFERFTKDTTNNNVHLDVRDPTEKPAVQNTLEALFAEIQEANKNSIASKLGNRNMLQIDVAVPGTPKIISDIVALADQNKDIQKLFAQEDVKNAVLNLIAHNITAKQLQEAFAKTDQSSQAKVANLIKATSHIEDTLKLFLTKGEVYFEQVVKAFKPFTEGYSALVGAHAHDLKNLIAEKIPGLEDKFSTASHADIVALGDEFEKIGPQIGAVIQSQTTNIGKFLADWTQSNIRPLYGLIANGIGIFRTIFGDNKSEALALRAAIEKPSEPNFQMAA